MSDRHELDFLFAVLALKNNFINREQFRETVSSLHNRDTDLSPSLADSLVTLKHITPDQKQAVEKIVELHLQEHNGDVSAGLNSLKESGFLEDDLANTIVSDPTAANSTKSLDDQSLFRTLTESPDSQPLDDPPAIPEDSLPSGAGSSRFASIKKHAQGGLGEIYVARDMELNREVALKEMQPRFADDISSRRRFVMEGEVTGSLEHPGVVPVYGMGADANGRPYYAMRFIRGESMSEAIDSFHARGAHEGSESQRSLALQKLLRRFIDVCNTIHYAHSRGVLHRDLKPDNIMLGPYGETLVVDWGLAKIIGHSEEIKTDTKEESLYLESNDSPDKTRQGNVIGTLQYMSPEQAMGWHDRLAAPSDVFSLGAILYKLLTGQAIYFGKDVQQLHQRAIECSVAPARQVDSDIPKALEAICKKALASKVEHRYASAKELADDIESWLADEPVTAWQEPFAIRARRWMRRHTAWVTGSVAALTVGLLGTAIVIGLLSMKNREVQTQRDVAEENWQTARSAVLESLVKISEDPRLKEESLEDFRLEMLESARPYYERFLAQEPDAPQLQLEQAQWRTTFARIQLSFVPRSKTNEVLESALATLNRLVESFPDNNRYKLSFAQTIGLLGASYAQQGELTKSNELLRRGIAVTGSMAQSLDGNKEAELVSLYNSLGTNLLAALKYADAEDAYRQAEEIQAAALNQSTEHPKLLLATPQFNRASVQQLQGKADLATAAFESSLQRLENVTAPPGYDATRTFKLASLYLEYSSASQSKGRLKKAYELLVKAEAFAAPLAENHPDNATYQLLYNSIRLSKQLPGQLRPVDQPGATLKDHQANLQRARTLASKQPSVFRNQTELAQSHAAIGFYHQSQNELEKALSQFEAAVEIISPFENDADLNLPWRSLHAKYKLSQAYIFFHQGELDRASELITSLHESIEESYESTGSLRVGGLLMELIVFRSQLFVAQGKYDQAIEAIDKVQAWLTSVPETTKVVPGYWDQVAQIHQTRADIFLKGGQSQKLFAELDKVIDVRTKLVSEFPDEPVYSSRLAWHQCFYGMQIALQMGTRGMDQAAERLQRAVDEFARIDPKWIETEMLSTVIEAQVLLDENQFTTQHEATAMKRLQSLVKFAQILEERTGDFQYLLKQSQFHIRIGDIFYDQDNEKEMMAAYDRSISAADKAMLRQPENRQARAQRAWAYKNRGDALRSLDRNDLAYRDFDTAAETGSQDVVNTVQLQRGILSAMFGNYQTAVEQTRKVLLQNNLSANDYYLAACVYSQAFGSAQEDDSVGAELRGKLVDEYSKKAIALLAQTEQAGYFESLDDVEYMHNDPDFDPIRDLKDYKSFDKKLMENF